MKEETRLPTEAEMNERLSKWRQEEEHKKYLKEQEQQSAYRSQKNFYEGLIEGLESGELAPTDVFEWEDPEVPLPEKIAKMDKHDFRLLEERTQLARELTEARKRLEKRELEVELANQIISGRDKDLGKKLATMTPAERMEFERRAEDLEI